MYRLLQLVGAAAFAASAAGLTLKKEGAGMVRDVPHLRDLVYTDEGKLVFSELKVETHLESQLLAEARAQLYPVKVRDTFKYSYRS